MDGLEGPRQMKIDSVDVRCPRCGAAVGVPLELALPRNWPLDRSTPRVHLEVDDFECRCCGLRVYFRG